MKCNTNFDSELKKIEKLNKNWLPWIGEKYFDLPSDKRLIIIGESCYETEDVDINQENYIRKITEKQGMEEGAMWDEDPNKFISQMHTNLEKSLSVDTDNIEAKRHFWERVCYFNIIQTPLKSRSTENRPPWQDFLTGWDVFYQVLSILNPSYCLFNGVEASNHFYPDKSAKFNYYSNERALSLPMINDAHPRKIILKNNNDQLTKIIFIKHSSSYFSTELWKDFINKEFEGLLPFKN
ncbi:MAG TPA: hypothetical protein VFI29_04700 [Hanamia sp.]|nr:hypothetical protein [Hanamia sp.]